MTRDSSSVTKFYKTVFGYEEEPVVSADFDYVTLHVGGHPVAGIHGVGNSLPRDRGPHWMTYFEVSDTDAATTRLVDLGGHVVQVPHDSAHGRVATVTDPEGAMFSLIHAER